MLLWLASSASSGVTGAAIPVDGGWHCDPAPDGFRIELDPSTRTFRDGAVLVGGSPTRALALSPAGRTAVSQLQEGRATPAAARVLGRRLVDAWMAGRFRPSAPSPRPRR